jgi:hypothetical protein
MAVTSVTMAKAVVLKAAIDRIAGDSCLLVQRENSVKIILTEKQKAWFQQFLNAQLDMKRKPDIEIDAIGIIAPVLIKRFWPWAAAGGGALAAIIFGKNRADSDE